MHEVFERLFVSSDLSCRKGNLDLVVVHACKSPCHQSAVGYTGSLPNTHTHYLVKEDEFDLYLNIIDPKIPLFMPLLFTAFLAFTNRNWTEGKKVLIHCNQGESRAPSLALLFMAKSMAALNNDSYQAAKIEFEAIYPNYNPGKGIQAYFSTNWATMSDI